jgi:hypothetical protein
MSGRRRRRGPGGAGADPLAAAGRRRLAAAGALVVLVAGAAGCGTAVETLSFPPPPSSSAPVAATTPPPFDGLGVTEATVPSVATTIDVHVTGGGAEIRGSVVGPTGPVAGATVQLRRFVADRSAATEVVTSPAGRFRVGDLLGGRYRLRAWASPTMAMTSPQMLFLGDHADQGVTLRVQQFTQPTVTSAFSPDPTTEGQPTTIAVEVSRPTVTTAGIVRYTPAPGVPVILAGGWTVAHDAAPERTDAAGVATFVASCETAGVDPLTALVGSAVSAELHVPPCLAAPAPTTTSTSTTVPSTTATSTTVPSTSPTSTSPTSTSPTSTTATSTTATSTTATSTTATTTSSPP